MTGRVLLCCCVLLGVLVPAALPLRAQSSANPDISFIARFLLESDDGAELPERRVFGRPDFSFEELEIVASAYLNPFATADVVLAIAGPDPKEASLDLEEIYATVVRGLPLDLNLRFGKYRTGFGKLNVVHPHARPFVTQPLLHERFLGEEGLNDLGVSLSTLLPTGDVYSRLSIDVLRGSHIGEGPGLEDTTGARPAYAVASRLMGFFTLGDDRDLEAGVSFYTGIHDPYARERFWYWNLDVKYKYRPDLYTSLVLQGEVLLNRRRSATGSDREPLTNGAGLLLTRSLTTGGMYLYASWQFMKVYNVGIRADWVQAPYGADDRAVAAALFAGYYPVEETLGLRLEFAHLRINSPGESALSVNSIALQALFSMGPHKAHPF